MKHQKKLQKGLACVLSMLCLFSLCAGVALAAPGDENTGNEDIQLRFLNNRDGTDYTAYILTGNTIQVRMDMDQFSMSSDDKDKKALLLRVDSGNENDVSTAISGSRNVYTLSPVAAKDPETGKDVDMQEPVTYVANGNVNSITPPKSGYVGMVQSGGSSEPTGARLMTSQAISQRGTLTIKCTRGESPNHTEPEFEIVSATGAFAAYAGGEIGVVASESDLSGDIKGNPPYVSVNGEKRITFTLSQPGAVPSGGSGNGENPGTGEGGETGGEPGTGEGDENGGETGGETGNGEGDENGGETGGETGNGEGDENGGETGGETGTGEGEENGGETGGETETGGGTGNVETRANTRDTNNTTELRSLKLSFVQSRRYDQIADDQNSSKYLEENEDGQWVVWVKDTTVPDDKPPNIRNNYIREGTTYTLTFDPPSSTNLYLRVATPEYVAENEIKPDLAANNRTVEGSGGQTVSYPYLELAEGDTLQMIARDSMRLITKDERWNATFNIEWKWIPDPEQETDPEINWALAQRAVQIPAQENPANPLPVTINREGQENDITGKLVAKIKYNGQEFDDAIVEFPLTVRGTGVPATIQSYSQSMGQANSEEVDEKSFAVKDEETGIVTYPKAPTQLKMDVFAGGIADYPKNPYGPYESVLQLSMGMKNAKSYYAIASLEGDDVVDLLIPQDGTFKPYAVGSQHIENPSAYADFKDENGNPIQGTNQMMIRAKGEGTATLKIEYYIMLNGEYTVDERSTCTMRLDVKNNAPKQDATLSALSVRADASGNPVFPFEFNPETTTYSKTIELPYAYRDYILDFKVNDDFAAQKAVTITATDIRGLPLDYLNQSGGAGSSTVQAMSGRGVKLSVPETSKLVQLTLVVTADDPRITKTYTIFVQRAEPSLDDMLSTIGVYAQEDTEGKSNFITDFDPETRDYVVTVPYSTQYLRVSAAPNFPRAELAYTPALESMALLGAKEFIAVDSCTQKAKFEGVELPYFRIDVTPEVNLPLSKYDPKGPATGHYRIFINRLPPSENSLMGGMTVVDAEDTAATPKALAYTPNFNAANPGPYRLTDANAVPYSTSAVRFKIKPQDELFSAIRIYNKDKSEVLATITNPEVFSEPIELKARSPEILYNEFVVEIVSEAGDGRTGKQLDAAGRRDYYTEYRVQIERAEANTDADLLDVALNDQDGEPLKMFSFHRDETNYQITVPYAARSVSFTAKTNDASAIIQLKDHENLIHATGLSLDDIVSERPTKLYNLNAPGSPRTFDLIVTAEDGKTTKTYTFIIDREPPSSDALLKKLTVEGLTEEGLTPIFKPHDTAYSGTVEEGAEGVRVTLTANDKNATIMVDGMEVESGQLSELIELLEVNVKLDIVVTAEDGVTQKTYTIDLYNQNLVDKTNNADLSSLKVERGGVMTPDFQASVTEYDVAVKEDTYSVDIIPKTDDPLAEIKVLSGTRELGDYNGNYALALTDGENQVTVRVTSPDKTQVKDYSITIHRNQEDALKTLTPLTADDLDFETLDNPVIISISEYPRIESSVFNALKEYPEKTIIFQGLDYSLTFQAANLNTVIPTREIYDFRLAFESPDAEAIQAHMGQWEANADIMDDLMMIYFDYHGDLPGPAMLNLKLGNKYGGQTLYWHYYNRERKVIEFYGTLLSNSQGVISVPINHFSTYLLTRTHVIIGAENYGSTLSQIQTTIGAKQNPTTGKTRGALGEGK